MQVRIAALEKGESFAATQTAIQNVQAKCLQQLRNVRAALDTDGHGSGASASAVAAQTAENNALQRKVEKLEYRVQHLLASMEYLYEKAKTKNTPAT